MSSQDVTAKLSKLKLQAKAKVAKEAREAKGGKSDTTKRDGTVEKEKVILETMKKTSCNVIKMKRIFARYNVLVSVIDTSQKLKDIFSAR